MIAAKVQGRVAIESLVGGFVDPPSKKLDFFEKYKEATTDGERLDVVREAYRLLLPSNIWLSALETKENEGSTLDYSDQNFDHRRSIHVPLIIQAINDDSYDGTGLPFRTGAYEYGTERYQPDFDASAQATCPFLKNSKITPDNFAASSIDGETMIPAGHEKLIPIYDKPKYAPFGLGYRRCAGEILNYSFLDLVLSNLADLEFEVRGDEYSKISASELDRILVLAGLLELAVII